MATKISLKQLGDDVLKLLGKSGTTFLEKDITSNTACGAAPSGTIFSQGQSFTEFAEKLLRKDITPTITTSFSGSGLKEIGTVVNGCNISLSISNLNSVTVPINEIRFYNGNTLLNSTPFLNETSIYNYTFTQTITSNTTLKAELIYNGSSKISGTGSFTFVYASYYGSTNLSHVTDTDANVLTTIFTKAIKNTKSLTWNNIILNDERFCYMYPKNMGELSSIKDGNGFSQLEGYILSEVNLTNPINGDVVPYYVYLLKDSTTGTGFSQIYA